MGQVGNNLKQLFGFVFSAIVFAGIAASMILLTWPEPKAAPGIIQCKSAPFLAANPYMADSLLKIMTIEEKVGQLIMIAAENNSKKGFVGDSLSAGIRPGGFYFTDTAQIRKFAASAGCRRQLKVPLMYAAAAEYGFFFPADTISGNSLLPALSSISDDTLIAALAASVAKQMKEANILINFAPSFGIIEKNRDLGYDPSYSIFIKELERKTLLYVQKLQEQGVMACAAPFPNYRIVEKHKNPGDTIIAGYPDTLSLDPFRSLVSSGLSGIMAMHGPEGECDTVDYKIIDSLHKMIPFDGLVISDFSRDHYYQKNFRPGEAELTALRSGSDMVLIKENINETFTFLLNAVRNKALAPGEIDRKVKKILLAKSWGGLFDRKDTLKCPRYNREAELVVRQTLGSSLVLLTNRDDVIPLKGLSGSGIASLCIGEGRYAEFESNMEHYAKVSHYCVSANAPEKRIKAISEKLSKYNTVIVGIFPGHHQSLYAGSINEFLHDLGKKVSLVVVHFGTEETLALLDRYPVMMQSFGSDAISQEIAAQAIYGGAGIPAVLPYTCALNYCYGDGVPVDTAVRLKYGMPEEAGIAQKYLRRIDSLIDEAIDAGAFPGCQVFIARKGIVIMNRSCGFHTYDKETKVKNDDLYDLASVTKVAAGTLAMMALYDLEKIPLDSALNYYFKDLDKNARGKKVRDSKLNYITVRQLMTHTSGLPAGLPVARFISPRWYLKHMLELERRRMEQESADSSRVEDEVVNEWMIDTTHLIVSEDSIFRWLFSKKKDKDHQVQLGEDFFMREAVIDSVWQLAKQTYLRKSKSYLYSDMNFYLVMKIVESVTHTTIDKFMREYFYKPLNLEYIRYTPLDTFEREKIVPTEEEKIFRKQLIHGYVHDPTAALLGGISGNAGLFSNAEDLGILMQMLLNRGTYGGHRYLAAKTVDLFTSVQEGGYRGLGWDHQTKTGMRMIAPGASVYTYGHTGFTGTCVWVDPATEIVYVFLSNRVHPKSANQKINILRVRQNVQQLIYDALKDQASHSQVCY